MFCGMVLNVIIAARNLVPSEQYPTGLKIQWKRTRRSFAREHISFHTDPTEFDDLTGARSESYLTSADDVNCLVRVSVVPVFSRIHPLMPKVKAANNPWATIKTTAPVTPTMVRLAIPRKTKPMCATLELPIKKFRSFWRIATSPQ